MPVIRMCEPKWWPNGLMLTALSCWCLVACGGGGSGDDDGDGDELTTPQLSITLSRIPAAGLDPIAVQISVEGSQAAPSVEVDRGTASAVVASGTEWTATVTPSTTGEYTITATLNGVSASRTAIVVEHVHADWGQPEMVRGLVNTDGYEDGPNITPDGRYLFVQYGPYYWAGLQVFNTARASGGAGGNRLSPSVYTHPWMDDIIGPIDGPQRPGFPTARIADGKNRHNAVSWGVGDGLAPNLAWSTVWYGFERQADGRFANPFKVAFDDLDDGLINPFGISFQPLGGDTYRASFSLGDGATTDGGFDLYQATLSAGTTTNLGTYVPTTPGSRPARSLPFAASLIDLGTNTGTQGNNFLELDSTGAVQAIWTDDEYDSDADTHKLTVHVVQSGSFPASASYTSVVLPGVVNVSGTEAIQPCMASDGLFFTQDVSIAFAGYSGSISAPDYANAANWSAPVTILQKDTGTGVVDAADIGKIIAIGEPTVAVIDGHRVLYFVYARVRAIDPITGHADLDFQVGLVRELLPAIAAPG